MLLLTIFAFLAGMATALSPCALPVLPVVFSASLTGGRCRPLGIAAGLVCSFTFSVVALVYVIDALGLPNNLLRDLAIAVLLVFGLSLLVPAAGARVEALISRITSRRAVAATASQGNGFWSGLVLGGGLGLVYAPCAGPILAGVITVSASQELTAGRMTVALAYGLGSAVTFFALMLGGRRLVVPLVRRGRRLQLATGAVMVAVAFAMFADLDIEFESAIADSWPAFVVNPTKSLEQSSAIKDDLDRNSGFAQAPHASEFADDEDPRSGSRVVEGEPLKDLGQAPAIEGGGRWFNTPGGRALTGNDLEGRVVLVDFWTYTCINCIRTLPHVNAWAERYRRDGLTVIGVHAPEFPFEREAKNVASAIDRHGLVYPVVQDNDFVIWNAFYNQYWPAKYLIDATGRLRYAHFGEGQYDETERAIRSLLAESGEGGVGEMAKRVEAEVISAADLTPESYLGAERAARFENELAKGSRNYGNGRGRLERDHLRLTGRWRIGRDQATARSGAGLDLRFRAKRVFLVLSPPAGRSEGRVRVTLDGSPLRDIRAGRDVAGGVVIVRSQRLYDLVDLARPGVHDLRLEFGEGVSGYAFTFG